MNDLHVTITEEEAQMMIEKVARFVAERGMASAGILAAESLRPLHGIGSQFMFFILPFAEIIFDSKKYQHFALLLEKEDYVRQLINRMDELDEELNHERRQKARLLRQRKKNQIKAFFQRLFRLKKKDKNEKDN
ncbi:MAG: hypothetical protein R6V77_05520 [Candidatus Cloacimonadaceae bacterium]